MDRENGEFWVGNPFMIPKMGENLSAYERNCLFLNIGGGDFINASFASNADLDSDSRAAIPADFDRDGAVDLLVGSVGGGSMRLFRNRFPTGMKSIRLQLEGTRSNRTGIGSRVTLTVGGRKIVRDLFPADGFSGQAPAELTIGIGEADRVDKVEIRWPSGVTGTLENLPAGSEVVVIREDASR